MLVQTPGERLILVRYHRVDALTLPSMALMSGVAGLLPFLFSALCVNHAKLTGGFLSLDMNQAAVAVASAMNASSVYPMFSIDAAIDTWRSS